MTVKRAMDIVKKCLDIQEWEEEDQMLLMLMFIEFAKQVEPLVDKYDTSKGFKLFGRMDL